MQFQEYAGYIKQALLFKGYSETKKLNDAEIIIFLGYGIGDPKTEQYTYSVPTWGQTGVSSSHTYGNVDTFGNYSGTTTYTPRYGITGYNTHVGSRTTFFRYMFLEAIDVETYTKTKKIKQVWKTTVTSTGSSGDLRQVFPILVAASKPHIGTNTGKKIEIRLKENDTSVLEIKGESIQ